MSTYVSVWRVAALLKWQDQPRHALEQEVRKVCQMLGLLGDLGSITRMAPSPFPDSSMCVCASVCVCMCACVCASACVRGVRLCACARSCACACGVGVCCCMPACMHSLQQHVSTH